MSVSPVTTVITDNGMAMLRAAPGNRLVYTRAACGSGHVDKTLLVERTEVTDYEMDLSIMEVKPSEDAATVRLQLDNSHAAHEFHLYQIGLYAKLLDASGRVVLPETLFQIMQYEQPDIVRAVPHVSEFVINTLIGQAAEVSGLIDLASLRQFNFTINDLLRSIMMNEITLPVETADGKELLTSSGKTVCAVYRPNQSASILTALETLDGRLSGQIGQVSANCTAQANSVKQYSVTVTQAYTDGRIAALQRQMDADASSIAGQITQAKTEAVSTAEAKIAAAKQESIAAASADAAAKVSAHNTASAAHPTHLAII